MIIITLFLGVYIGKRRGWDRRMRGFFVHTIYPFLDMYKSVLSVPVRFYNGMAAMCICVRGPCQPTDGQYPTAKKVG